MSYYFTIPDFLKKSKKLKDRSPISLPINVHMEPLSLAKNEDEVLVCQHKMDIWDIFQDHNSSLWLASLLNDTQIYRLSLEILLDKALIKLQGTNDNELNNALEYAFIEDGGLPNALPQTNEISGELNHHALGHISCQSIAKIYLRFLEKIQNTKFITKYSFHNVISLDRSVFYDSYDGFKIGSNTFIRFDKLIKTAKRQSFNEALSLDDYVSTGKNTAKKQKYNSASEYLKAYMRADRFQYLLCQEIDALLSIMAYIPDCLRYDIFKIIEKEAMKQVFAEEIVAYDGINLIAHTNYIKMAVEHNSNGDISERLQRLVSETLDTNTAYAGAAGEFVEYSQRRQIEAETIAGL